MADPIAERLRIVERDWDELRRQNNMLIELNRTLEDRARALAEALRRYGAHWVACPRSGARHGDAEPPCTCGLAAALDPPPAPAPWDREGNHA